MLSIFISSNNFFLVRRIFPLHPWFIITGCHLQMISKEFACDNDKVLTLDLEREYGWISVWLSSVFAPTHTCVSPSNISQALGYRFLMNCLQYARFLKERQSVGMKTLITITSLFCAIHAICFILSQCFLFSTIN